MPSFLQQLPTLDQRGKCAVAKADLRTRKQVKGQQHRTEAQIIQAVRAVVVDRDAGCRLAWLSPCTGLLEWAHLEQFRRHKTRNMPPETRHTTAGTALLCQFHHAQYDLHEFRIVFETDRGADGPFHIEPAGPCPVAPREPEQ